MIDFRQEVIKKLDSLYSDIPIYGEEVPQGFKEPSFFVKILTGSHDREFNVRYKRSYSFNIHYFEETNKECEAMAKQLYENMEYLSNNVARGFNMHHETVNRVLHFFVDYSVFLIKEIEQYPKMSTLEVDEVAK